MLQDENLLSMVVALLERGLSADQIELGMRQMIGADWKDVDGPEWLSRLIIRGFVLQNDYQLTVNDLEALIKGRIKLDELAHSGLEDEKLSS